MKNLFIPILFICLIVGFGCKNMFRDKSFVGKWRMVKEYDPKEGKWKDNKNNMDYEYELFENGDIKLKGSSKADAKYKLDTSANPDQISIIYSETDTKFGSINFKAKD